MMPLQPGVYEGVIYRNDVKTIGGKEYVELLVDVTDDFENYRVPTKIWLTDKAMNIARAALKKVGFDVAATDLDELATNNDYLAGRPVTITVDVHAKYGISGSVNLDKVSAKKLGELTRRIRNAEDDGAAVVVPPEPAASSPMPDDVAEAYERDNVPLTPQNRAELTEKAKAGGDIPF